MVTSPEVSWLFFKARAKRPYLSHTGRATNAEKQPTGPGQEGCDENGPAAALLVGHVSVQICSLLTPCRRPILTATTYLLFRGQDTTAQAFNLGSRHIKKSAPEVMTTSTSQSRSRFSRLLHDSMRRSHSQVVIVVELVLAITLLMAGHALCEDSKPDWIGSLTSDKGP